MQVIDGKYTDADGRYAIVVGRFNQFVVDSLVEGAIDALVRHGVSKITSPWFMCLALTRFH